ncbi:hypothetical protein COY95_02700 [Candidatus Woesearchaeota archaeon CG_4_10_14_0_8_um_filter_47_5]|nr:MAG: hypothetical protein COY95_02700 [Candidatus Woesearchaeota archaeon CG_4_10_14_0_8_um_filter_47_5]
MTKNQPTLVQIVGAMYDFAREYFLLRRDIQERREANDHFHHARANCNASLRGPWGRRMAEILSDGKELYDYVVMESPLVECFSDQIANTYGRRIREGQNPAKYCQRFDVFNGGMRIDAEQLLQGHTEIFQLPILQRILYLKKISEHVVEQGYLPVVYSPSLPGQSVGTVPIEF